MIEILGVDAVDVAGKALRVAEAEKPPYTDREIDEGGKADVVSKSRERWHVSSRLRKPNGGGLSKRFRNLIRRSGSSVVASRTGSTLHLLEET